MEDWRAEISLCSFYFVLPIEFGQNMSIIRVELIPETVSPELAAQIETCELNASVDIYEAAPEIFPAEWQLLAVHHIVLAGRQ